MYNIFPLSLILRLDAIFTLARHVQLKIMPIPLFKTKCYQILVSKPLISFKTKRQRCQQSSLKRAAKTCNLLQNAEWKSDLLPPSFIPVNNFGNSLQGRFDVGGKTRNIAIQLVWQQRCKTSCIALQRSP